MVLGRLFAGSQVDSNYYLGVFTGTGRDGGSNDGGRPMLVGRWQWNLLRRELGFSQSDIPRTEETAATLALGAASHRSRFTRFSSDGGGQQLPGFADGQPGQYDTRQWMGEFALKNRGLSVQAEYHSKTIGDRLNHVETRLSGYYAQAGYFFSESWPAFPAPLELAVRYAQVDGRSGVELPDQRETTTGFLPDTATS